MIQQYGRPISIHLQPAVEEEIKKFGNQRHIEKAENIEENCFVSPAEITTKKEKSASQIQTATLEMHHLQPHQTMAKELLLHKDVELWGEGVRN